MTRSLGLKRFTARCSPMPAPEPGGSMIGLSGQPVATRSGGATAPAVAAIRLLMLTGCRKSEILTLRWENVALDEAELRLADSKTGARVVSLSQPAVKLLASLPCLPGNPWVIPGRKPGTHLSKLDDAWAAVRSRAGLHDVRLHDLRRSCAVPGNFHALKYRLSIYFSILYQCSPQPA